MEAPMNRQRTIFVAAVTMALGALPVRAMADVTDIVVTPNPPVAGQYATIKVEGTGQCTYLTVDFGDGSPLETQSMGSFETFPQTFYHLYRLPAGPRTITVTPGKYCSQQRRETVTLRAGQVVQVIASYDDIVAGNPLPITVAVDGDCGRLRVSWGDGFSTDFDAINSYPVSGGRYGPLLGVYGLARYPSHPYAPAVAGATVTDKTILAEGIADCGGSDSAKVRLHPAPGYTPPPAGEPRIDAVYGTVTPGARILVVGSGFGKFADRVSLSPGGPPRTTIDATYHLRSELPLTDVEWQENYVLGTVPPVTGVNDQSAAVTVRRNAFSGPTGNVPSATSEPYLVAFTATRQIVKLPVSKLNIIRCDQGDQGGPAALQGPQGGPATIGDCSLFADSPPDVMNVCHRGGVFGTSGQDHYAGPTLRNGWRYDQVLVNWSGSGAQLNAPSNTPFGKIEMSWSVQGSGSLCYAMSVSIIGPKDVFY
jgi:hypothetical protein